MAIQVPYLESYPIQQVCLKAPARIKLDRTAGHIPQPDAGIIARRIWKPKTTIKVSLSLNCDSIRSRKLPQYGLPTGTGTKVHWRDC